MRAKVVAEHAINNVTKKSRAEFLVYLNWFPIYWSSMNQTSVESSSFGYDFFSMKQCCENILGLWCKLWIMGIPCKGTTYIQGGNQSVPANTAIPYSKLRKKNQSIAYHYFEKVAYRDKWWRTYANNHGIEAGVLTKIPPSGGKRKVFVHSILHHIFVTGASRDCCMH